MWIALAALALIAVGVAIVVMFRRPAGDDIESVRSYHSALGTLEHLADRNGSPTVTAVAQDQPAGETRVEVARTYRRPARPTVDVGSGRSVPPAVDVATHWKWSKSTLES